MSASQENVLVVEQFLTENYMFRRNVLNGKVEFAKKAEGEDAEPVYRPLTQEALNSIVLRALREEITESNPKADIQMYVNSEEVPQYNPIGEYLDQLPAWDASMGRREPCGTTLLTTAWYHHRAGRISGHLATLDGSPLDADGRVARQ